MLLNGKQQLLWIFLNSKIIQGSRSPNKCGPKTHCPVSCTKRVNNLRGATHAHSHTSSYAIDPPAPELPVHGPWEELCCRVMKRKEVVRQVLLLGNSGPLVALLSGSAHSSIFLLGLSTFTSCRGLTPRHQPQGLASIRINHAKHIWTLLCQR